MKRFLCILMLFPLLLSGCGVNGERIKEPVTFYYPRAEYAYGPQSSVIGSEERESSGHRNELSYLLAIYLLGPSSDELVPSIPGSVRILSTEQTAASITIEFTDTSLSMTDAEYSLACACLSMTCMGLTDAERVTVRSGSRSVTMDRDNLTLHDGITAASTEETQ